MSMSTSTPAAIPLPSASTESAHGEGLVCLSAAVLLLSTITPAIKYVFEHAHVSPLQMASARVGVAFLLLLAINLRIDRETLWGLRPRDLLTLSGLGTLGVGAYAVAAWGLQHTTVTHYILIYSLLPSLTALLNFFLHGHRLSALKSMGIALSFAGCVVAASDDFHPEAAVFRFGDALVLLFTLMIASHLVFTMKTVKRVGALTANTVMFASTIVLFLGAGALSEGLPSPPQTPLLLILMGFIGVGTGLVFLLRCIALKSLSPVTVAAFHTVIPVITVTLAYVFLHEPLDPHAVIGGAIILTGVEVVRRAG